jgi:hypothetical protein
MTAMPWWSAGVPEAIGAPRTTDGATGHEPFRSLLGAIPSTDDLGPPEISSQFKIGDVHLVLEPAATRSVDDFVDITGRRLRRRGYSCGPPYPAEVAGFADGRARVVAKKKRFRNPAGEPQLQLYAVTGRYSLILTVTEAQAGLAADLGSIRLDPPASPAITPVVQIPAVGRSAVEEKLVLTRRNVRLTAVVSPGLTTTSTDDFAITRLESMRSQLPDMAVGDWQPDVFLGGWPCARHTFVHGGVRAGEAVRSEYWWAGVVTDRGIQIFVLGTKAIIDLDQARRLQGLAVLVPPG